MFIINIIVTLDNKNAMLFNGRRQSRDAIVNQKILEIIQDRKLFLNNFSWKMFKFAEPKLSVTENFLKVAKKGDFCFVENESLKSIEDKIEKIYVFKWNRDYPGDFFFDINLEDWKQVYFEEFSGSSHESIYLEVYEKGK